MKMTQTLRQWGRNALLALIQAAVIAAPLGALPTAANAQVPAPTVVTGTITTQNLSPLGSSPTAGSSVEIITTGKGAIGAQFLGTWTGTVSAYCTLNSGTWVINSWTPVTANGISKIDATGCVRVRVAGSAAITGSAAVTLHSTELPLGGSGSSGGDASAANQVTGNASLASIDGKVPTPGTAASSALATSRVPVTAVDGAQTTATCSSSCNGTRLFTLDMTGYNSSTTQVVAAGTGATVQYEFSDDGTTYYTAQCINSSFNANSTVASTTNSLSRLQCGKQGRYFSGRFTAYSSGTVTYTTTLHSAPFAAMVLPGAVNAQGQSADNAANSGSPLSLACIYRSANSVITSTGSNAICAATKERAMITKAWSIPEAEVGAVAASGGVTNSTADQTLAAAAGGTLRNYLTQFDLMCTALATASEITIRDGSAGTVLWRGFVGTGGQSLASLTFPNPKKTTANTALIWKMETASATGACYGNASVYQAN